MDDNEDPMPSNALHPRKKNASMPTSEDAQEKEHYLNQTSIVGGPKSSFSRVFARICMDLVITNMSVPTLGQFITVYINP